MNLTIHGTGYVGLVTGVCLAELGNNVVCVDVDPDKISVLKRGQCPIYEPGLETLLQRNLKAGRLNFTTDIKMGVQHGAYQFIAVGTPPDPHNRDAAELCYVFNVARDIARYRDRDEFCIIVDKSTVPVGTTDKVAALIREVQLSEKKEFPFTVVSNPEFLREGHAVDDFMHPDRIIIGVDNDDAANQMRALYESFMHENNCLMFMDVRAAELTKYAANALLATKISFMNELSHLAEQAGVDIEQVKQGIGADHRIGPHFIDPGCGYGGSCFPKDVSALIASAAEQGVSTPLLNAVQQVNEQQKRWLFHKISSHFEGHLAGKTIALWGLAFKPNTDDMREAPSRTLLESLWSAGTHVQAYDPAARDVAYALYGDRNDLKLVDNKEAALHNANALVIVTDWPIFVEPDWFFIKENLSEPVIFDGRNLYDPKTMAEKGFVYYSIGRQVRK